MFEYFAVFMTFSVPLAAIIGFVVYKQSKLKHEVIRDEIELEKLKHENYLLETEKLKLELEKMRLEHEPKDKFMN